MTETILRRPMWRRARAEAIRAHGDQLYGGRPYVVHLDEVATVLAVHCSLSVDRWNDHLAAAYLHDVVEDCGLTREDLMVYGQVVVDAVMFCTDEPGATRRERKAVTYARCRKTIDAAPATEIRNVIVGIRVKLADRIANLRACLRDPTVTFPKESGKSTLLSMYVDEDDAFRNAYGADWVFHRPRESDPWLHGVAGFVRSLWDEYAALVRYARILAHEAAFDHFLQHGERGTP